MSMFGFVKELPAEQQPRPRRRRVPKTSQAQQQQQQQFPQFQQQQQQFPPQFQQPFQQQQQNTRKTRSIAHTFDAKQQFPIQQVYPQAMYGGAQQVSPQMLQQQVPVQVPTQVSQAQPPQQDTLQAKMEMWKKKREQKKQEQPEQQVPQVPQQQPTVQQVQQVSQQQSPVPQVTQVSQQSATDTASLSFFTTIVDGIKAEVEQLRKRGPDSAVLTKIEQEMQQIAVNQQRLKEQVDRVQVSIRAMQERVDTVKKDAVSQEDLENVAVQLREERHREFASLEDKIRTALKNMSDQTYWMYGVTAKDLPMYEGPSFNSAQKGNLPAKSPALFLYPMQRTEETVWMRARTVAGDGRISIAWVPVVSQDPETPGKTVKNVSKFQLTPGNLFAEI